MSLLLGISELLDVLVREAQSLIAELRLRSLMCLSLILGDLSVIEGEGSTSHGFLLCELLLLVLRKAEELSGDFTWNATLDHVDLRISYISRV